MDIREQTRKLQSELGIPTTTLCRKLNISPSAYYRWQNGDLRLSAETENRISTYINKLAQIF